MESETNASVGAPDGAPDGATNKRAGRLLVVVAAVMWSTSGLFVKSPAFQDWPLEIRGVLIAFWRAAFASLALLPMIRRPRWSWRLIPMVMLFAAMNVTFLTAMAYTEASAVVWLQNVAPLWVFLVAVFWFRERAVGYDWLMVAFGLLGVGLIIVSKLHETAPIGVMCGLLSSITFAGVVLALRQLRDHDAAWLIALNHIVTTIVLAPFVLYHNVWPHGEQWFYLAAFGVFQIGIPYVIFARAVRSVASHEASCIVLLEPILVPLWVFLAWRNDPNYVAPGWWTLVGGGLILSGLMIRYIGEWRRRFAPAEQRGS